MVSVIRNVLSALIFSLMAFPAYAFTITFEDGLSYGLGHGPVPVQDYNFDGFNVSFTNGSYADTPQFSISGQVTLARVNGHAPVVVNFNSAASQVSVWALSGLGKMQSTITAYGLNGQELGSDSYIGPGVRPNGTQDYMALLSVSGGDIYSVVMDGQFWVDNTSGWYTAFDDLSVLPATVPATVPEPETNIMTLLGLGCMALVVRCQRPN